MMFNRSNLEVKSRFKKGGKCTFRFWKLHVSFFRLYYKQEYDYTN